MLLKEHLNSFFGGQKDLSYFAWVQTLESKAVDLTKCLDDIRTCDRWTKNSLDQLSNVLDEVPLDKPIERNLSSTLVQQARTALLSMLYHLLHVLGSGDEIDEHTRHSAVVLGTCYRIITRAEFDPTYLGIVTFKDGEATFNVTAAPEVVIAFRQYIDLLHRLHAFISEYLMANIPIGCDVPVRLLPMSKMIAKIMAVHFFRLKDLRKQVTNAITMPSEPSYNLCDYEADGAREITRIEEKYLQETFLEKERLFCGLNKGILKKIDSKILQRFGHDSSEKKQAQTAPDKLLRTSSSPSLLSPRKLPSKTHNYEEKPPETSFYQSNNTSSKSGIRTMPFARSLSGRDPREPRTPNVRHASDFRGDLDEKAHWRRTSSIGRDKFTPRVPEQRTPILDRFSPRPCRLRESPSHPRERAKENDSEPSVPQISGKAASVKIDKKTVEEEDVPECTVRCLSSSSDTSDVSNSSDSSSPSPYPSSSSSTDSSSSPSSSQEISTSSSSSEGTSPRHSTAQVRSPPVTIRSQFHLSLPPADSWNTRYGVSLLPLPPVVQGSSSSDSGSPRSPTTSSAVPRFSRSHSCTSEFINSSITMMHALKRPDGPQSSPDAIPRSISFPARFRQLRPKIISQGLPTKRKQPETGDKTPLKSSQEPITEAMLPPKQRRGSGTERSIKADIKTMPTTRLTYKYEIHPRSRPPEPTEPLPDALVVWDLVHDSLVEHDHLPPPCLHSPCNWILPQSSLFLYLATEWILHIKSNFEQQQTQKGAPKRVESEHIHDTERWPAIFGYTEVLEAYLRCLQSSRNSGLTGPMLALSSCMTHCEPLIINYQMRVLVATTLNGSINPLLDVVQHLCVLLAEYEELPAQFDTIYLCLILDAIVELEHHQLTSKLLQILYSIQRVFVGQIRKQVLLECILAKHFFTLFLNWDDAVRQYFMQFIIFKLSCGCNILDLSDRIDNNTDVVDRLIIRNIRRRIQVAEESLASPEPIPPITRLSKGFIAPSLREFKEFSSYYENWSSNPDRKTWQLRLLSDLK